MAIALTETLVSPADARLHVPGQPHVSTIWRWMRQGSRGVVLDSLVCAGRRYTSLEAIDRFITATTAAANHQPPPPRTPHQRARAIMQAETELDLEDKRRKGPATDAME